MKYRFLVCICLMCALVLCGCGKGEEPAPAPEATAVPTATPAPTAVPTATPAPTQVPTATPAPTEAPTATPAPTATAASGCATKLVSGANAEVSPKYNADSGNVAITAATVNCTACAILYHTAVLSCDCNDNTTNNPHVAAADNCNPKSYIPAGSNTSNTNRAAPSELRASAVRRNNAPTSITVHITPARMAEGEHPVNAANTAGNGNDVNAAQRLRNPKKRNKRNNKSEITFM